MGFRAPCFLKPRGRGSHHISFPLEWTNSICQSKRKNIFFENVFWYHSTGFIPVKPWLRENPRQSISPSRARNSAEAQLFAGRHHQHPPENTSCQGTHSTLPSGTQSVGRNGTWTCYTKSQWWWKSIQFIGFGRQLQTSLKCNWKPASLSHQRIFHDFSVLVKQVAGNIYTPVRQYTPVIVWVVHTAKKGWLYATKATFLPNHSTHCWSNMVCLFVCLFVCSFVFEAPKLAKGKMLEKGGHHQIACVWN